MDGIDLSRFSQIIQDVSSVEVDTAKGMMRHITLSPYSVLIQSKQMMFDSCTELLKGCPLLAKVYKICNELEHPFRQESGCRVRLVVRNQQDQVNLVNWLNKEGLAQRLDFSMEYPIVQPSQYEKTKLNPHARPYIPNTRGCDERLDPVTEKIRENDRKLLLAYYYRLYNQRVFVEGHGKYKYQIEGMKQVQDLERQFNNLTFESMGDGQQLLREIFESAFKPMVDKQASELLPDDSLFKCHKDISVRYSSTEILKIYREQGQFQSPMSQLDMYKIKDDSIVKTLMNETPKVLLENMKKKMVNNVHQQVTDTYNQCREMRDQMRPPLTQLMPMPGSEAERLLRAEEQP